MDVAHPGKSAPSANSKSVILSNRPLLKDPMVVDDTALKPAAQPLSAPAPADTAAEPPKSPTIAELAEAANAGSQPLAPADEPKPEGKPEKPETAETDKPESDKPKDDGPADKKPETEADAETEETPASKDDNAKQEEAAATKQAEHQAAVDKLADSKQYYLPINTVEKRRSKRFVAIGILLSLLLILAWTDIALDAGLIKISGIKPLTHFFST
jgi:type IV secretory pathway VirB10-like protein